MECSSCPSGTYAPYAGTVNCTTCPLGKLSSADRTQCATCQAGQYTLNETSCEYCELGKYAPVRHVSCVGASLDCSMQKIHLNECVYPFLIRSP